MKSLKYIFQFLFLLALVVVGIYFGSENSEQVRIVVLGNLLEPVPIWFLVLVAFFFGASLAGFYFSFELIRLWMEVKRLRKQSSASSSAGGFGFKSTGASSGGGNLGGPRMTPFSSPSYAPRAPFGSGTPTSTPGNPSLG
jgi:uncharacterized membrane protein YciS (DUF1049 family)